jgi:3-deoxy-D-manno-octulosonic-acid transferase
MITIYNLGLFIYYLVIRITSLFNVKAYKWVQGRKNWFELLVRTRKADESWIWFHCSSLGEYEDSCEVFFDIKKQNPQKKFLLSFFSPSGYEGLPDKEQYDLVLYMPLDTVGNASKFLNVLKPDSIFFSRSEIWCNFINEIRERKIPLFLLSFRLTHNSNFFKWPLKHLFLKCFNSFTQIYCQDDPTKQLLSGYLIENTTVTGNTRFDRIYNESLLKANMPFIDKFVVNSFIIVAGSIMSKDEIRIFQSIHKLNGYDIKWILVPHEITQIPSRLTRLNKLILLSQIENLSSQHKIIYVDSIGILKKLYTYANLAIIGGGFNRKGIHNIIEPAVYGVKSVFGPNYRDLPEAKDLMKIGGAQIYRTSDNLSEIIRHAIENPQNMIQKEKIIDYLRNNCGANTRILKSLNQFKAYSN